MEIEFDPIKSAQNIARRGLSFELARGFDFDVAWVWEDMRFAYGEVRYGALGPIGALLVVLIFTRRGETVRVISLRVASKKERKLYGEV